MATFRLTGRSEFSGLAIGVIQFAILVLSVLLAGVASFLYADGHDHPWGVVVAIGSAVGAVGLGLVFLNYAVTGPPSALPRDCGFQLGADGLLDYECEESWAEAQRRAARESGSQFVSDWVIGPTVEFGASLVAAVVGYGIARVTTRTPPEGHERPFVPPGD